MGSTTEPGGGHELQGAPVVEVTSDHEIMELAMKDIVTIRDVLSMERPPADLKGASNLILAYQNFLRKLRVEHNMKRPWESLPHSEVTGYTPCEFDMGIATLYPDKGCTSDLQMHAGFLRGAAEVQQVCSTI